MATDAEVATREAEALALVCPFCGATAGGPSEVFVVACESEVEVPTSAARIRQGIAHTIRTTSAA